MTDLIPLESIFGKILILRNEKVLLDRDLAVLYGVETRVLNQAVSRNMDRFPSDFMFGLTRDEIMGISQTVISSKIKYAKRVRAFTEHGAIMLASVLSSLRAIETSIFVVRAFVSLRKEFAGHRHLAAKLTEIENRLGKYDDNFRMVFEAIRSLLETEEPQRKKIGFTAKEAQAKYGGETMGKFTPQAKRFWEAIPADMRLRIMNNVWCVNCTTTVGIGDVSGKIQKGMLVLEGRCTRCGGSVARVVEND